MNWFAMVGTLCLGIVVIWLVRLFAVKLDKPEIKWLSALMAALLGGVALGFLGHFSDQKLPWPREFWFYPIGMALGLFLFSDAMKKEMDKPDSK
jgi:hypothetical protein